MAKFKYAVVVRGEVEARNRSSAYQLVLMGLTMDMRLMTAKHEVGIDIREAEVLADQEDQELIPAVPPFAVKPRLG